MLSPRFIPQSVFYTQSVVRSPQSVFYTDRLSKSFLCIKLGVPLTRTLTTHLYSINPWLILFQCYNASYFLCSLVVPAVNLWKCHVATITFLAAIKMQDGIKCPSYNIFLIGRNKKRAENFSITSLAMLQCTNRWRPRVFSIMPKIPKMSLKSISVSTILGHYVRFWIFWRESFESRSSRLKAQARRLAK